MKRFIATHTFHSEEARAGYFNVIKDMPPDYNITTPHAICLQVFNSESDFFFCHWVARSERDIQATLNELGMDNFINVDQPHEFVGKSALKAIKVAGVKRRFIGLLIDGAPFKCGNEHRWDVTLNGAYAGFASACAYSPRVGSNIGVGLISTAAIEASDGVAVVTDDGIVPARAAPFPLV